MHVDKASQRMANTIISKLKDKNLDYSAGERELFDAFKDGLFQGNWDTHVEFDNNHLAPLRIIEENEYDQSMDGDPDRPDWDSMIADVGSYYIFPG